MANEEVAVLQPDELIDTTEKQGATIQTLLNQQYATMQLLSGTALITLDANSQFFSALLGSFTNLGELSGAQLGEQQLYDASSLEGAAAMYLLVNTLSGNVAKMLPLLEQLGNSGGGADGANTLFGAIGAMGSLKDAGKSLKPVTQLGTNFGELGGKLAGAAGFFGKMAAFGPLLSSIAPLLIGGVLIAAIVGLVASKKKKKAEQEEQDGETKADSSKTAEVAAQSMIIGASPVGAAGAIAYSAYTNNKSKTEAENTSATQAVDSGQTLVNPYENPYSANSAYQGQIESRRQTADALREAVKTGNTEVAAQLEMVANALQKLAGKPADRNVRSKIVINTLKTNATLSEFKDMLNETLLSNLETVE